MFFIVYDEKGSIVGGFSRFDDMLILIEENPTLSFDEYVEIFEDADREYADCF